LVKARMIKKKTTICRTPVGVMALEFLRFQQCVKKIGE
jgi:hypothetical protein